MIKLRDSVLDTDYIHFWHKGYECRILAYQDERIRNEVATLPYRSKLLEELSYHVNGYVAVPKRHPFYDQGYNKINRIVSVHGGVTYALNKWPFEVKIEPGKWWLGFDTGHYEDTVQTSKNPIYVRQECLRLAEQCFENENYPDIESILE